MHFCFVTWLKIHYFFQFQCIYFICYMDEQKYISHHTTYFLQLNSGSQPYNIMLYNNKKVHHTHKYCELWIQAFSIFLHVYFFKCQSLGEATWVLWTPTHPIGINSIYFSMHFYSRALRIKVFAIIQLQVHGTRHLGREWRTFTPQFIDSLRVVSLLNCKESISTTLQLFLLYDEIISRDFTISSSLSRINFTFAISFSFLLPSKKNKLL